MKEEDYETFIKQLRNQRPQLKDERLFKNKVMASLVTHKSSFRVGVWLRIAASVMLLISLGSYIWMEVYTWEKRLAVQQDVEPILKTYESDWQCRQKVNTFISSLSETKIFNWSNGDLIINKQEVIQLSKTDKQLYVLLKNVLTRLEEESPAQYQAFESGENLHLTAWDLRKNYDFCEWISE